MRTALTACLSLSVSLAFAQEARPEKQPKIVVAAPLAVTAGGPVKLLLRGLFLDEVTEVRVVAPELKAEVASKGKAAQVQDYDPKKFGDSQCEVKFVLPPETPDGAIALVAVTAQGTSTPYEIALVRPDDLVEEKEPNDGFKLAQLVAPGKVIVGTIHEARNVDVFRIEAKAGQRLTVSAIAAQAGALLDPMLTVYGSGAQVLAAGDDSQGTRDPRVEVTVPKDGSYFVAIQDAHDRGGPHFVYRLNIQNRP